jgi:hypothetical protein
VTHRRALDGLLDEMPARVRVGDLVVAHPALRVEVSAGEPPAGLDRDPGHMADEMTQIVTSELL